MRPARILTAVAIVASVLVAAGIEPALAEGAYGGQDSSGITAGAGRGNDPGATARSASTGAGARATCAAGDGTVGPVNYRPVPTDLLLEEEKAKAKDGGGWYWQFCGDQSRAKIPGTGTGGTFFPPGSPGAPVVDPADLATDALQRTPLPEPHIGMSPKESIPQLVNLATFLWVDGGAWAPHSASATAGPVTSTVTATPRRVVWSMGNGDDVVCQGPGSAYVSTLSDEDQPNTCRYTYRRSSASMPDDNFTITATVEWSVTWTAVGAPGGGSLGVVSRASSTRVRVAEVQGLNANPEANP